MAVTDFRQRTAVLFVAVLLGQILLISAQVNSRSGVPLLELATFGVFSEVQRVVAGFTGGIRNGWNNYIGLRDVRADNEKLKRELGELQIEVQQERAAARRARQLETLLGFKQQVPLKTLTASVIGAGPSPESRTVTLDKGSNDGVRANMAVIAPTGVVGRIVTPSFGASKVQLLVDRNAGIGALIERSRAQGVVLGDGEEILRMNYVNAIADVRAGDTVITSGIDGIYPKGFVIGTVESVDRGNGIYKVVKVRPTVDFNRLEEVLVVTSPIAQAPAGAEGPS